MEKQGPGHLIETDGWSDYALLDSGQGRKLERFGPIVTDRPEPQALWTPRLPADQWAAADAVFVGSGDGDDEDDTGPRSKPDARSHQRSGKAGKQAPMKGTSDPLGGDPSRPDRWRYGPGGPVKPWDSGYGSVRFHGRPTPFRHVGYFPEQAPHWDWMIDQLRTIAQRKTPTDTAVGPASEAPMLLNLFGYTGVASLLAARAGAAVTHVDASKKALTWARENRDLSGMETAPIRWICEDARSFVLREGRRNRRYQGLILDPPKYGRGPKGDVWSLFDDLPDLLRGCREILDPDTGFLILTSYAIRASHLALYELCAEVLDPLGGQLQAGELAVREHGGGRRIAAAHYCRWRAPGLIGDMSRENDA